MFRIVAVEEAEISCKLKMVTPYNPKTATTWSLTYD